MSGGRFTGIVGVSHWLVHLYDGAAEEIPDPAGYPLEFGLLDVGTGQALLRTGPHTGAVAMTVEVADREPASRLDAYEDAVEVPIELRDPALSLMEFGGGAVHPLPSVTGGPGGYRLRYHARGMDAAGELDLGLDTGLDIGRGCGEPVDAYLAQIWPAPAAPPVILRVTSRTAGRRLAGLR